MKILKAIIIILASILLHTILLIPGTIIFVIKVLEIILRITKETLTFLIKQIQDEVLK